MAYMTFHESGTDQTTITFRNGVIVVEGWGGYDGHLKQEFDQIEDALDFVAGLWKMENNKLHYHKSFVTGENQTEEVKKRKIQRMINRSYNTAL